LYSLGFFAVEEVSDLHRVRAIFKSDLPRLQFIFRPKKRNVIFKDIKPPQLYVQEIILQCTATNQLRLSKTYIFK